MNLETKVEESSLAETKNLKVEAAVNKSRLGGREWRADTGEGGRQLLRMSCWVCHENVWGPVKVNCVKWGGSRMPGPCS